MAWPGRRPHRRPRARAGGRLDPTPLSPETTSPGAATPRAEPRPQHGQVVDAHHPGRAGRRQERPTAPAALRQGGLALEAPAGPGTPAGAACAQPLQGWDLGLTSERSWSHAAITGSVNKSCVALHAQVQDSRALGGCSTFAACARITARPPACRVAWGLARRLAQAGVRLCRARRSRRSPSLPLPQAPGVCLVHALPRLLQPALLRAACSMRGWRPCRSKLGL